MAKQITWRKCVDKKILALKKERKEQIHHFGTSPESQDSSEKEYCFTLTLKGSEEPVNNVDSSSFQSKIFATMKVGGQLARFQVDSGAPCNVISKNILPKECQVTPCTQVLNMFNGTRMQTVGKCQVLLLNVKLSEEHEADFVVINVISLFFHLILIFSLQCQLFLLISGITKHAT